MKRDDYIDLVQRRRQKTFYLIYISCILIVGSGLLLFFNETTSKNFGTSSTAIIIFGIILLLIAIGIILNYYLTFSGISMPYRRFDDESETGDINYLFNRHLSKNIIDKYGTAEDRYYNPHSKEKGETEEIKEKLFEQNIEDIKSKYISQFTYDLKYTKAFEDLYSLEKNTKNQISRLIGNSNLNLIIGTLTTLIAIIILGFSIYQKATFTNSIDLLSHYIPRISTVIFVEIFSFFFLKLYRKNLDEIKYFHNEMANLSFRISSLKASLILEDKETSSKIINEFAKVERNFILKEGETTERLLFENLDSKNSSNYLNKLTEIINSIKK